MQVGIFSKRSRLMFMHKTAIACSPYSTEKHLFYKNMVRAACTRPLLTAYNVHAGAINR